ncbi:pentapeptide repeat-containing protein [Bradyrhizobium sp. AZCC 1678]|uniref:pentapeptide repeat-containing protein n=1 Tax=Bradyrhizobium sp. AZCC 1678 TaxID=3117030 RepID=UPI002FF2A09A
MADEAFALSPISARATLPREEDYAAIAEAFMETSRGRWFLTEYAKRNRNADTRMVLDAVVRIEQSLASQREENLEREASLQREEGLSAQQAAEAVAAAAAAQERLTEALAAIRSSVEAAEESAVEALDSLALEQRLAPVRKGARVLREIAWRLREIGNDGRICDLIDSQVTVIEKGTDQFSSEEARAALRAAFAALQGRLVEFGDDDRSSLVAGTETAAPSSADPEMAAAAETAEATLAQQAAEAPSASRAKPAEAMLAAVEAVLTQTETPPAAAAEEAALQQAAVQNAGPQDADLQDADLQDADFQDADLQDADLQDPDLQDADAQDEAVLDMIAMEMGAPDPISDDEIAEAVAEQVRLAEPAPIAPAIIAKAPEPVAVPAPPPVQRVVQVVQPPPPPAAVPVPPAPMEVSLGSTIIASGMLRKPVTAANDPLAPIRRMSQAEKIAFFS